MEEDAAGAGVERVPDAAGGDGRARGRGMNEAGGAVVCAGAGRRAVRCGGSPTSGGAAVEAAEAAADGGGRDEAAPALSTTWTQKGKMVFS